MASKRKQDCRYCGKEAHGYGCQYSDTGYHVETGDSGHCIYCGSTNYGYGCQFNTSKAPKGLHIHGHGDKKCIYCGQSKVGSGCVYSPDGKHHF